MIDTSFNALKLSDQLGQKPGSSVLPKQLDLSRTKQADLSRTKQADPVIIDINNDTIVDSRTEAERVIDASFNALKLSDQLGQKSGSSVLPKQLDLSRTKQRNLSRTKQACHQHQLDQYRKAHNELNTAKTKSPVSRKRRTPTPTPVTTADYFDHWRIHDQATST